MSSTKCITCSHYSPNDYCCNKTFETTIIIDPLRIVIGDDKWMTCPQRLVRDLLTSKLIC